MDWIAKLPPWLASFALAGIALSFAYVAWAQPDRFEFAGLAFGQSKKVDLSLNDAVIPFDRKLGCPAGWTDVGKDEPQRFAGRVMIVAGPRVDRESQTTVARAYDAQGDMETHEHTVSGATSAASVPDGWDVPGTRNKRDQATGFGHAHATGGKASKEDHLPPYITLFFCKKAAS